jgi:hypothetical protein
VAAAAVVLGCNSTTTATTGGNGGSGQIILTWAGTNAAPTSVIAPVTYASVSDATPPNYNLTAIGTQDWQLFGDNNGSFTIDSKFFGKHLTGASFGQSLAPSKPD